MSIELMVHQRGTGAFMQRVPRGFNTSDPGTGKTIGTLHGYALGASGRLLVSAPLSILKPAWGNDIEQFLPEARYAIAHGSPSKRREAFASGADVVIINHDGLKWLVDHPQLLKGFSHFAVDEFTAFKNRGSARTKALARLAARVEHLWMLSGTPNPRSVLDLWAPAAIVDGGERLGQNFFKFREQMCIPLQVGPMPQHVDWVDRDDALLLAHQMLKDITIRYAVEECVELPPNRVIDYEIELPAKLRAQYERLVTDATLVTEAGRVNAVHAAALVKKILQLLTGAVYGEAGEVVNVHQERYELVMDLCEEREICVIGFNYRHERDALLALAKKRGLAVAVIDGSVRGRARDQVVADCQAGRYKALLCHPQSAAHGLTLTAATSTIWSSPPPTQNAEHYLQLNKRIDRKGQTLPTETVRIAARGTKEAEYYARIAERVTGVRELLGLFAQSREVA